MKKTWVLSVLSILSALAFTACASSADTMPSPSPSVSVTPSASPTVSTSPTVTITPTAEAGVNTVEDAIRVSDSVAEEVEKLSELDTATAIVASNIAIVGVTYDTQYQGGLTERMIEMVDARVQTVDKTLTTVHVTDDEKVIGELKALLEKLKAKDITFTELQTQVLDIASGLAGGGETNVAEPQSTTGA